MATQDREPVQQSAHASAVRRTSPSQIAQKQVRNLKIGIAGREPANQSPARKINGE